jgi:hypothetical protein
MSHPAFPVIEGRYGMTKEWSILLPEKFNRRFEEESLVIWHSGFTMWIIVWGNDGFEARETRLAQLRARVSDQAFDLEQSHDEGVLVFSYRLRETIDDNSVPALYGFAIGESGHVQMAIYFDQESDLGKAKAILKSLRESAAA